MAGHNVEHAAHLAHHFVEPEQQRESAKLGMWLFLLTEILLFGGLFAAYAVYRAWHPEMFYNAHLFLDVQLGTLNTVVLISSSLTMALAIRSIQLDNRKWSVRFLVITLLLASVFLIVKYFEYSHKFHLGQLPGKYYIHRRRGCESAYLLQRVLHDDGTSRHPCPGGYGRYQLDTRQDDTRPLLAGILHAHGVDRLVLAPG